MKVGSSSSSSSSSSGEGILFDSRTNVSIKCVIRKFGGSEGKCSERGVPIKVNKRRQMEAKLVRVKARGN